VAAAVDLLAAKGFRGSTIAELAEQVGMTHPNWIYYFGTKERLLREVVEERERREDASFYATLDSDVGYFTALNGVAHLIVDNAVFTRLFVVLGSENLDDGDPLHDFFVDRYKRARQYTEAGLRSDQKKGRIRPDVDIDQIGREVVSTLMGLEIQWLMDPESIDFLGTVAAYGRGLHERLAPRP
jgi:AcrR family transcriptional regulator